MAPLRAAGSRKGEKGHGGRERPRHPCIFDQGALAHRVAFHYNALKGVFADSLSQEELPLFCGEGNRADRNSSASARVRQPHRATLLREKKKKAGRKGFY
jgi:hypothetical protein